MANMNTGRKGSIGPVESTPISDARCPSWKTKVMTPSAAPMLSRFITAALAGITSDRKTTASRSSESPTTTSTNSGSFADRTLLMSTVAAVAPPMLTRTGPSRGTTSERSRSSRFLVATSCGLLAGKSVSVAVSPARLYVGAATAATPGWARSFVARRSSCARPLSPWTSATTRNGPLNPEPNPCESRS